LKLVSFLLLALVVLQTLLFLPLLHISIEAFSHLVDIERALVAFVCLIPPS
jgi:hypothetical protein